MKNTQQTSKEDSLQSSLNEEENYPPMPDDPIDYQEEGLARAIERAVREKQKNQSQQKQEPPKK
ncbi:MAG: hypothetical protein UZ01_00639 [Candidatus Brocadia sinica]|nr:MAG: hypothetical protein UZ01_00639 [Candidatus Brocadia sinica]